MTTPIRFEVPIETRNTLNSRVHFAVRAKRVAAERRATAYRIPSTVRQLGPFLRVILCRRSPRRLDSDNLQGALKSVRDQVACALGVDDRTSLVKWVYRQEKGEPAVIVTIEHHDEDERHFLSCPNVISGGPCDCEGGA